MTVEALGTDLRTQLVDAAPGQPLSALDEALIELGVRTAVTALDPEPIRAAIATAFAAGATPVQVQEVVTLVSGLGVHSLMIASPMILAQASGAGLIDAAEPLDEERAALRQRYLGDDGYWRRFEEAFPGFLDALLRLSPTVFKGFFDYCALPWKTGSLPAVTAELIALATDAAPSHVFPPGAYLHFANALKVGAGRDAILRTLEIATACPAPASA